MFIDKCIGQKVAIYRVFNNQIHCYNTVEKKINKYLSVESLIKKHSILQQYYRVITFECRLI